MKSFLTFLLFASFNVLGQSPVSNTKAITIKGVIVESLNQKSLKFPSIGLKDERGLLLETASGNEKGEFIIQKNLSYGKYYIEVAVVSHSLKSIPVVLDSTKQSVFDFGNIGLSKLPHQLAEVVISAEKPLIKQEIDRLIYNATADPESNTQNVLDLLRKVPLVSVNAEDQIQVKGSSSFRVFINGRPSSILASNVRDIFKTMSASNIERIEIITTPPSKYESEGLVGIINIISRKRLGDGYNAGFNIGHGTMLSNTGGSLDLRKKKLSISLFGGASRETLPRTSYSNLRTEKFPFVNRLEQDGEANYKGYSGYFNTLLSYEIDSLNLFSLTSLLVLGNDERLNNQNSNLYNDGHQLQQSYILNNEKRSNNYSYNIGLNYQLGFKDSKEHLLTTSYSFSQFKNNQNNNTISTQRINYSGFDIIQNNDFGGNERTAQIDYVQPHKKINMEGGIKVILRNNFSNYLNENSTSSIAQPLYNQSNNFNYSQNIYSFYNSYHLKLKSFGIKSGLRLERTLMNFVTAGTKDHNYNNLIPTIVATYNLKNNQNLNLGYTQRIQRPGIFQLNPFIDKADPRFYFSGNPDLRPVLNHNFEFTYSKFKKANILATVNYTFARNTIQSIITTTDTISSSTYQNLGLNKNLGFSSTVNVPFTKNLRLNTNTRISYVWLEGWLNNTTFKNDGFQGSAYAYLSNNFKNNWRLSINGGVYSSSVLLQGKSNAYYYTSVGINKSLYKRKLSLSGTISNPFQKYREVRTTLSSDDFFQANQSFRLIRNFNFNISYRFGQMNTQVKRNKRSINNDDIKNVETRN